MSPAPASPDSAGKSAESALEAIQAVVAPGSAQPVEATAVAVDIAAVSPGQPAPTPTASLLLCLSAGFGLAVLTTWVVREGTAIPGLEVSIHRWVLEHRTDGSVTFARLVTWGGVTSLVLPALIVVGALAARGGRDWWRRLQTGLVVTAVASVGVFVGLRINAIVGRARPPEADWAGAAGGPSFPSGHTSCATLVALAAAWVIADRARPGWPRALVWVGAGVWAFSVGASRVWLGVHWPTDVLGGWLFGLTWFAGSITALALLRGRGFRRRAAAPARG